MNTAAKAGRLRPLTQASPAGSCRVHRQDPAASGSIVLPRTGTEGACPHVARRVFTSTGNSEVTGCHGHACVAVFQVARVGARVQALSEARVTGYEYTDSIARRAPQRHDLLHAQRVRSQLCRHALRPGDVAAKRQQPVEHIVTVRNAIEHPESLTARRTTAIPGFAVPALDLVVFRHSHHPLYQFQPQSVIYALLHYYGQYNSFAGQDKQFKRAW